MADGFTSLKVRSSACEIDGGPAASVRPAVSSTLAVSGMPLFVITNVSSLFPSEHPGREYGAHGEDRGERCDVVHVRRPSIAFQNSLEERDRVRQRQHARDGAGGGRQGRDRKEQARQREHRI